MKYRAEIAVVSLGTSRVFPETAFARGLKGVVRKALEAFLSVFDGCTVADIAGNRAALAELLHIRGSSREAT